MYDETKVIEDRTDIEDRQEEAVHDLSPMDDQYWSGQYQRDVEKAVLDHVTAWGRRKSYNVG